MRREDVEERTLRFAIDVVRMTESLPRRRAADVLIRQVVRSGTSIGANDREASRASSRRHFITLVEMAQREASETLYWLEVIMGAGLLQVDGIQQIRCECDELLRMLTASVRTAKRRENA